jgi:hypothetical protein
MKNVTFTPLFDLMFDWQGITHQPSGTTPHNPNQVRIVFLNCKTSKVSDTLNAECIEAVEAGEYELKEFIRANFRAQGERAARQVGFALNGSDDS